MNENRKEGGLSLKGSKKKSRPGKPLISVVSVCLNDREGLEETMKSVVNQTYDNIEYLIIDGASDDGSIDFIKNHENFIDYWVSGQDGGIYDGMNKGIRSASGEWIIFMNAGDAFFADDTVSNVVGKIQDSADLIYGDQIYRKVEYGDLLLRMRPGRPEGLWKGMVLSHQAMFVKSRILKEKGFDCNYKIIADYDLVVRLYREGCIFQRIDEIIAVFVSGGESYLKRMEARKEHIAILRRHGGFDVNEVYLFFGMLKMRVVNVMESVLPHKLLCVLYRVRHLPSEKIQRD